MRDKNSLNSMVEVCSEIIGVQQSISGEKQVAEKIKKKKLSFTPSAFTRLNTDNTYFK